MMRGLFLGEVTRMDSHISAAQKVVAPEAQSCAHIAVASHKATVNLSQGMIQGSVVKRTFWQKLLRFFRLNILFLAIGTGVSLYFLFHYVSFLAPIKYPLYHTANVLIPFFIFAMLFISFSRVEISKMHPRRWHFLALLWQVALPYALALIITHYPEWNIKLELEGVIGCVIMPTAAAATVITGKLGGDESSITTFTMMSNLTTSISIPLIFPLISTVEMNFWDEFIYIFTRVFPMIGLPLIVAQFVRYTLKPINHFVVTKLKDVGYYLWATTLVSMAAIACSNMVNSHENNETLIMLAFIGLVATAVNFAIGKGIGHLEGQRISCGQGMGQKNMAVGIWMTSAYLSPVASIAPSCYILWQNIVNSYQIWYRDVRHLNYTDKF